MEPGPAVQNLRNLRNLRVSDSSLTVSSARPRAQPHNPPPIRNTMIDNYTDASELYEYDQDEPDEEPRLCPFCGDQPWWHVSRWRCRCGPS
jgi:ribosomal protein S27AE